MRDKTRPKIDRAVLRPGNCEAPEGCCDSPDAPDNLCNTEETGDGSKIQEPSNYPEDNCVTFTSVK